MMTLLHELSVYGSLHVKLSTESTMTNDRELVDSVELVLGHSAQQPATDNFACGGFRTFFEMPKRTDIRTIMIIGSGPIVIGQSCEFDYSETQACKSLREEGYRVVLIKTNPATIMTDPDCRSDLYEPIVQEFV